MDGSSGNGRIRPFDILITPTTPPNGRRMLRSLVMSNPKVRVIEAGPPRDGAVLMLYGLGGLDRYGMALRHVEAGGTLVAWDVGYWDRKGVRENRKLRVSINGLHPPQYVMRGEIPPPDRWKASHQVCIEDHPRAKGTIVLVGNGPKSNVIGAEGWAAAKSKELRAAFPDAKILYRPKPKRPMDAGVECDECDGYSDIGHVLQKAMLVVCRHSNVAIDACLRGIPVVCDDGAAAAIYPKALEDWQNQPSHETRKEFLQRLAYWQWSEAEAQAGLVWPWLFGVLDEIRNPVPALDH